MLKPVTTDIEALKILDERLRWLSAWTIHHANHVRESHVMPMPFVESLFGSFGKSKISYMAEALLHSVVFVGFQEFQRAQDAELI